MELGEVALFCTHLQNSILVGRAKFVLISMNPFGKWIIFVENYYSLYKLKRRYQFDRMTRRYEVTRRGGSTTNKKSE
jgi:hypothetical protein